MARDDGLDRVPVSLDKVAADALDIVSFLGAPSTTDRDVAHVAGMTGVRMLDLYGTRVSDAAVPAISTLVQLEWLSLTGTNVTDTGVADLAGLSRLERLSLKKTRITDGTADTLVRLSELRWLSLAGTAITAHGLERLTGVSALTHLSLTGCPVRDAALAAFSSRRPDVQLMEH